MREMYQMAISITRLALLSLILSGCSREIDLQVVKSDKNILFKVARVDLIGKLTSTPPCVNAIVIREIPSARILWKAEIFNDERCVEKGIIEYGERFPTDFSQRAAHTLTHGKSYHVYVNSTSGSAESKFSF